MLWLPPALIHIHRSTPVRGKGGILNRENLAMSDEKIREDRIRRALAKRGYLLRKTPARSWLRQHYGVGYMIVDANRDTVISGCSAQPYSDSLDDVETFAFISN